MQTWGDFDEMITFYTDCLEDMDDIYDPFDAVFGHYFDGKSGSKYVHSQDFEHQ